MTIRSLLVAVYGSTGGAPRRWAPAGSVACDEGPELIYHRHPFSTYDDPRNLSGVKGIKAMGCIVAQSASKPPRRPPPRVDYSGLLQTEHFVLVPLPPVAPAQQPPLVPAAPVHQPPRGLQNELLDAGLSRGYMSNKPSPEGLVPQHADDRKMPAVTRERVMKDFFGMLCMCARESRKISSGCCASVQGDLSWKTRLCRAP